MTRQSRRYQRRLARTPRARHPAAPPLDIRHVAIASANLAYGLNGVDYTVSTATVVVSFVGVLLVGLTNLAVSFGLALRVALRSRGITREQTEGLWGRMLQRFLARPRDFFWPPAPVTASPL